MGAFMTEWTSLLTLFILAVCCSFLVTPLVRKWAVNAGILDQPGHRKPHQIPVPRLGGIGLYLGVTIPVTLFFRHEPLFPALMTGGTIIFLVGLADDVFGLKAVVKQPVMQMSVIRFKHIFPPPHSPDNRKNGI